MVEQAGHPDDHLSRTDYLRAAFGEPLKFKRGETIFTFHPLEAPEGFAAGFFARSHAVSLRREDLTPYTAENYEPALAVISLDKAQVVWMEDRPSVGSPKLILESFFAHLLRKSALKDWRAFISYFETHVDYWEAVRLYRNEIVKATFRFVPPNAFEGRELAQVFYTELQKEAHNEELEQTFKAPPGKLQLDGPMMAATAEIAEQGAGERELRGPRNRLIYSSEQGRVIEKVDESDMPTVQSPNFISRVIARLFGQ